MNLDNIKDTERMMQKGINAKIIYMNETLATISERKESRGFRINTQTEINEMTRKKEEHVSDLVYERLVELEQYKEDGVLNENFTHEVHGLFLFMCEHGGRLNSRYVKMPKEWTKIGLFAGILEDLIVILRTPAQIGLGEKHIYTLRELFIGFEVFLSREKAEGKTFPRFMFFTRLLQKEPNEIVDILIKCINAQGNSKRIGFIKDEQGYSIYAIQGILGNVQFDDRVTRVLTVDNCPPYAVHFTKANLAKAIWDQEETKSVKRRPNGDPILKGHICKFERPIHALTNVTFVDGKYRIYNVDKDIRDRMAHGIKTDVERPKYQAGLVINVKELVSNMAPGSIRQNEIGTLLVNGDIPHKYLLHCIQSDEDIEAFWEGA